VGFRRALGRRSTTQEGMRAMTVGGGNGQLRSSDQLINLPDD